MFFTHVTHPIINRPFVKMLERTDGHYYETESGKIYPSITTILKRITKSGIDAWRERVGHYTADKISRESTDVGTKLHEIIERYLNNDTLPVVEEHKYVISPVKLFETIKPILHKISNIHALETKLYSDEMELAGTVDCIAEFEGVLSIIDFKNSRKKKTNSHVKNYYLQECAYKNMWLERTGMDIKQGVTVIATWDGGKGEPIGQEFKTYVDDHQSALWDVIIDYDKSLYTA